MAEKAELVLSAADRTAAAFASAQRNLTALQGTVTGLVGKLGAIGAGVGAVGFAFARINPASVLEAADNLQKLSQRSGVAVENLSALQYAGKLADVSTEDLATALKKLNQNIAAAARGEEEQAAAFKTIGVSVTDAAGKVRSADAVFEDIAERFAGYNDGAKKVALANAVGGKSFEALIPLLNGGREGLREARSELEKFGGVISGELAGKAEKFNDNMTRLGVAANSLQIAMAGGVVDSLAGFSERAVDAARKGELLWFSMKTLADLITGGNLNIGAAFDNKQLAPVQAAKAEVDTLTARVQALQKALAQDPGNAGLVHYLAQVERAAKEAGARLDALRANQVGVGLSTGQLTGAQRAALFDKDRTPVKVKTDAPALPKTGSASSAAADAEALLRRTLDGRIKAIQDGLETERDLFQFNESRLAEMYQAGKVSIDGFFDQKAEAQRDFLAKQQQGFDEEIAALRAAQAKMAKPQDRQDIENKVNEVLARQAKAYREAGQAAEVAETQRQRAAAEFSASLRSLDAQIAELSGDRFGAELLRNAEELDKARALLAKGGGDPEREQALASALRLQAEFNKAREDNFRIAERAQQAEEAFLIHANRAGLSRAETEAGITRIRDQSIAQLDALIARTEELVAVSTDPELIAFYDNLRLMRERAFEVRDPGLMRFNELARDSADTLADGFEALILKTRDWRDVLRDVEQQLLALVTRDLITTPLAQSLTQLIKGLGAGGSGGGAQTLFSGIASMFGAGGGGAGGAVQGLAAGDLLSLFFHGGGVVGESGTLRMAPSVPLAMMPRYHGGGIAGLQPDEMHAVLRKGEEVLTQADPRHRDNLEGRSSGRHERPLVVNVQAVQGMSRETALQQGITIGRGVRTSMARR